MDGIPLNGKLDKIEFDKTEEKRGNLIVTFIVENDFEYSKKSIVKIDENKSSNIVFKFFINNKLISNTFSKTSKIKFYCNPSTELAARLPYIAEEICEK